MNSPYNNQTSPEAVNHATVYDTDGKPYYLYRREITLHGGRKSSIHYFSRLLKEEEDPCPQIPGGYAVRWSHTGIPYLSRE